jgi:hypothetical protein
MHLYIQLKNLLKQSHHATLNAALQFLKYNFSKCQHQVNEIFTACSTFSFILFICSKMAEPLGMHHPMRFFPPSGLIHALAHNLWHFPKLAHPEYASFSSIFSLTSSVCQHVVLAVPLSFILFFVRCQYLRAVSL